MAAISVETGELVELTQDLEGFDAAVERAEYRAINKVTDKAFTRSKRAIAEIDRLTVSYIAERMDKNYARPGKLEATITGTDLPRPLVDYGAKPVLASAPKAKGNRAVGIPAGKKQVGVRVGVKVASAMSVIKNGYIGATRKGNLGVFTRDSGEAPRFRYGPSLDQTFALVIADAEAPVADELEKTFDEQLKYELKGLL